MSFGILENVPKPDGKEKLMLFRDHNGSLLRQQPGAAHAWRRQQNFCGCGV